MDIQYFCNNIQTVLALESTGLLQMVINSIPAHIYYKNTDGLYVWCNDVVAHTFGLKSGQEIVGKQDQDLPISDQLAAIAQQNDAHVIKYVQQQTIIEAGVINKHNTKIAFLSQKTPIKNSKGAVMGIFGISTIYPHYKNQAGKFVNIKNHAITAQNTTAENANLDDIVPNLNITHKDTGNPINMPLYLKVCFIKICQGKATKQIARELLLSPRTIEHYIARIKQLLGCNSTKELLCYYVGQI